MVRMALSYYTTTVKPSSNALHTQDWGDPYNHTSCGCLAHSVNLKSYTK